MVDLPFSQISERINNIILPPFDIIIGIAEGGTVPASLIAYKLKAELLIIKINYRNAANSPIYEEPQIIALPLHTISNKNILIVDDVSVSGKTLNTAKKYFENNQVCTLTLKGKADFVLFPEISECVQWPWKLNCTRVFD